MKYYKTSDLAKATGVHPNTVRLYEEWGLLPPVPRNEKGYRLFTRAHMDQMKLARIGLRCNFCAGDIRRSIVSVIKSAASTGREEGLQKAREHLELVGTERSRAKEALALAEQWAVGNTGNDEGITFNIKKTAALLDVTTDTLRTWEKNGLIKVPQNPRNRYREYGQKEINRLKIIRALRKANYSIMSILRMMLHIDKKSGMEIKENNLEKGLEQVLDTPGPEDDIVYATDKWLTTLKETEKNAQEMIDHLAGMIM